MESCTLNEGLQQVCPCCFILLVINKSFGGTGSQSLLFTESHGFGGRIEDLCLEVPCCLFLGLWDVPKSLGGRTVPAELLGEESGFGEVQRDVSSVWAHQHKVHVSPRALSGVGLLENKPGGESRGWGDESCVPEPIAKANGAAGLCVDQINFLFVGLCSALAECHVLRGLCGWQHRVLQNS